LHLLRKGDYLRLTAPALDPIECRITGNPVGDGGALEAPTAMAEALARIQSAAGVGFPLPTNWNKKDGEMIYFWDRLLSAGQVKWYWPGYAVNLPTATVKRLLMESALPRISLSGTSPINPLIQLLGHEFSIQGQVRCEVTNMVVPNPRALAIQVRQLSPQTVIAVPLVQDDRTITMFYLDRDESPSALD
jgi:hypothetical protein